MKQTTVFLIPSLNFIHKFYMSEAPKRKLKTSQIYIIKKPLVLNHDLELTLNNKNGSSIIAHKKEMTVRCFVILTILNIFNSKGQPLCQYVKVFYLLPI